MYAPLPFLSTLPSQISNSFPNENVIKIVGADGPVCPDQQQNRKKKGEKYGIPRN